MIITFRRYNAIELASIANSSILSPMNLANHLLKLLVVLCADPQALVLEIIDLRRQLTAEETTEKPDDSQEIGWRNCSGIPPHKEGNAQNDLNIESV